MDDCEEESSLPRERPAYIVDHLFCVAARRMSDRAAQKLPASFSPAWFFSVFIRLQRTAHGLRCALS